MTNLGLMCDERNWLDLLGTLKRLSGGGGCKHGSKIDNKRFILMNYRYVTTFAFFKF
jgi:hypothetical protein